MKWLRKRLINYCIKGLFNGVTEDDIIKVLFIDSAKSKGHLFKGEFKLNDNDKRAYANQAETIKSMQLWGEMQKKIKYIASERMVNKSVNFDDLYTGKMLLYASEIYENLLNNLIKIKDK